MLLKIKGLLQKAGRAEMAQDGPERQPSQLTFSTTRDYPEQVEWRDEARHRVLGKRSGKYVYAVLANNMSAGDTNAAAKVKSLVVEQMLSMRPDPASLITSAYSACFSLLAGYQTSERKEVLAYMIAHDIVGSGPISMLLEDSSNIEEIEINSPTSNIMIFHSKYGRCTTNLRFTSEQCFRFTMNRLIAATEKELNSSTPIIDAQLSDGSRLHAQLNPYSISGAAATIRLNGGKSVDLRRLICEGSVTSEALAYLWLAIDNGQNIIISGAPASGKTSMLLSLNALAPSGKRVVTIEEDINELKFHSNFVNIVSLQASSRGKIDLKSQVINALHMRPERLIIGEIRGPEAREVFSGSNLGIPFMTTMHSSANGGAIIDRLLTEPMSVEPHALTMLDISLYTLQRAENERLLESIVEYRWHSRSEARLDEVQASDGPLFKQSEIYRNGVINSEAMKSSKVIERYCALNLVTKQRALKELKTRADFIEGLKKPENAAKSVNEYIASFMEIK